HVSRAFSTKGRKIASEAAKPQGKRVGFFLLKKRLE
ncbi:uncharacterized protein METZ01_LOCUS280137, partial [marine metagenome]